MGGQPVQVAVNHFSYSDIGVDRHYIAALLSSPAAVADLLSLRSRRGSALDCLHFADELSVLVEA